MMAFTGRLAEANRDLRMAMAGHPVVLGLDELAGAPSAAMAGRLGVVFARAARFELAVWEMCWSGQAWPG